MLSRPTSRLHPKSASDPNPNPNLPVKDCFAVLDPGLAMVEDSLVRDAAYAKLAKLRGHAASQARNLKRNFHLGLTLSLTNRARPALRAHCSRISTLMLRRRWKGGS